MAVTTPEWIARRDGSLKLGSDNTTWYLLFGTRPHYSLTSVPAQGKFTCAIRQTENGKRIESPRVHATSEEAIQGGLQDLGKDLGWL